MIRDGIGNYAGPDFVAGILREVVRFLTICRGFCRNGERVRRNSGMFTAELGVLWFAGLVKIGHRASSNIQMQNFRLSTMSRFSTDFFRGFPVTRDYSERFEF